MVLQKCYREKHKIRGESLNLEKIQQTISSPCSFNVQCKARAKSTANKMCHLHSGLLALLIQGDKYMCRLIASYKINQLWHHVKKTHLGGPVR